MRIKDLEEIRTELRSIMKFREGEDLQIDSPKIDVTDDDVHFETYQVKNKGVEMAAYKERVEEVLKAESLRGVTPFRK